MIRPVLLVGRPAPPRPAAARRLTTLGGTTFRTQKRRPAGRPFPHPFERLTRQSDRGGRRRVADGGVWVVGQYDTAHMEGVGRMARD